MTATPYNYSRLSRPVVALDEPAPLDPKEEAFAELEVADYLVFLLAFDTYMRWLKETGQRADHNFGRGLMLLKMAERDHLDKVNSVIAAGVKNPGQLKMLAAGMRLPPSAQGASMRALKLRTVISRGGTATAKHIFGISIRARKEVTDAIEAATTDDAASALTKFSGIVLKNKRLEKWISTAAETAGKPIVLVNPTHEATKQVAEDGTVLRDQKIAQDAARPDSEDHAEAQVNQANTLARVENQATEAAAKALVTVKAPDEPVTRSQATGIATAVATAVANDPADLKNVPPAFINDGFPLDPEQMDAALTNGRVLVAAGAGSGKCIRGDTLVRTTGGLIPIDEFAKDLDPNTERTLQETVFGLHGLEPTSTILNNGRRKTIRLTTRLGYTLEGTSNHPVWIMRDGELQWVPLGEMLDSDYVCIDRRPGLFAEEPYSSECIWVTSGRGFSRTQPSNLPSELTLQVASLLGYIVSEGHVVYGSHSLVNLTTTDAEQLTLYKKAVDGIISYWNCAWNESEKHWYLNFYRQSNLEHLAGFGLTYVLAHEKEVPLGILRSPRPVVVAFLRALFDGDGWFSLNTIGYGSASEKLSRQVHTLLLSFGIVSRLKFKPNDKRGSWDIAITGDNARLFLREIGFNLRSKQESAEAALHSLKSNPNLDVIPGLSGLFYSVMEEAKRHQPIYHHPKYHAFKCYRMGTRNPSKKLLCEFLEAYPVDTDDFRLLRGLSEQPWFYDAVDELTESEADVYDFVVPGTHSFSAGGFVNHNSTTLVSRVANLVDQGTSPSKIMAVTFNKKAANELQEKLQKKLGPNRAKSVMCDTMHTVFKKFITGDRAAGIPAFGTPQEQRMMGENLIAPPRKGHPPPRVKPGDISRTIHTMMATCKPKELAEYTGWPEDVFKGGPPKTKKAGLYINKWSGNDVSFDQAKAGARSNKERQAAIYYEFYLGLKGDIPGWRPPCGHDSFNKFMDKYRRGGERLGDMDDMLKIFRDVLRRDPNARAAIQKMYDHILIDECVRVDTEVITEDGVKHAGDVRVGDRILSFENGSAVFKAVVGKKSSGKTNGVVVRTSSGREIAMTDEHRVYATSFDPDTISEGCLALYLMYRQDKGFRIGVTENPTTRRPRYEQADRLWVLEVGEKSEMLFKEQAYSLRFSIPTYVFQAQYNGCDQERIDRIFSEFGSNGRELLATYGLSFDYPHWISSSYSGANRQRLVIHLLAHRLLPRGSRSSFSFSWTGERSIVPDWVPTYQTNGRWMASVTGASYVEVREKAVALVNQTGAILWESVLLGKDTFVLTTAKSLFPRMKVLVYCKGQRLHSIPNGPEMRALATRLGFAFPARGSFSRATYDEIRSRQIELGEEPVPSADDSSFVVEEIVEVLPGEGSYVDLAVEDTANFFANGILSHNCQDSNTVQHQIYDMLSEHIQPDSKDKSIWLVGDPAQAIYQFRGAKPELFTDLYGKSGWVTKTIRTNYRCAPEIVETANRLLGERPIPMDALPAKHKTRGEASIRLETMPDNTLAAIDTVGEIRKDIDTDPKKCRPEDYAVLARTNAELNNFETACIINEVPYMRRGGHGFLDAPESKVVLGYLDLASGTDFVRKQKSLMAAITKPDRGLYLTVGQIETAVNEAVDDVARYERKDIKDVDPDIILTNRDYARKFAEYLKGPYKNQLMAKGAWLWNKIVDGLTRQLLDMGRDIHDIRKMTEDPNAKTAQLLGHVLDNVRATTTAWDPSIRREVSTTKTLREDISNSLKLYSSDDDDDDETTEEDEHKPELDAEGRPVVKEKQDEPENPAKGLGAVQFLYALSEPNKNDHELGILPNTAAGFTKKIERFTKLADSLRVDPKKWEDAQAKITDPALRQSKPPAVTLTTVHCSPPDEAILTTEGWIPIGKLDSSKHRLASYLKKCNQLLWNERYEGYPFITETRPYKGTLLTLETASSRTRVTPNHRVLVRFSPEFVNKYVVYLMRRGDWWRVGICVSARRPYRAAGVASRMSTEKADAGWILGVFNTRREALMEEAHIQAEWGIPGLTFESARDRSLSVEDLHTIHSRTVAAVGARVSGLLEANGLSADHPLYTRDGSGTFKNNFGHTFTTRACNVVSGYMEMLTVPAAFASQIGPKEDWTKPIYQRVAVSRELYEGNVYSLTVVPHHTYISGGAVVGNSVKGLEWPHATVLMPSGVFPIELKAKPGEPPPTPEEEHEHDISERNLAYVALTRAAKTLKVISIPNPKTKAVSPYIDQAGLTEGENVPKPEAPMAEVVTASDDAFTLVEAAESLDTEALYEIAAWPTESVTSYDRRPQ